MHWHSQKHRSESEMDQPMFYLINLFLKASVNIILEKNIVSTVTTLRTGWSGV